MVGVFAILKIQEGSNKEFESAARLMEEAVKKMNQVIITIISIKDRMTRHI